MKKTHWWGLTTAQNADKFQSYSRAAVGQRKTPPGFAGRWGLKNAKRRLVLANFASRRRAAVMCHYNLKSAEIKRKSPQSGGFSQHARGLLLAGFMPLPVRPGFKAACRHWPTLDLDDIAELTDGPRYDGWGLSVRCDGLAVIDIDCDEPAIKAAIWRALRSAGIERDDIIARRGSKGAALIFRATVQFEPRQWKDVGGQVIAELLAGAKRHCVLPPTIHPATGQPYAWLTDRTLFDLASLDELPSLDAAAIDRIAAALAPWSANSHALPERPRPKPADPGARKITPADIPPRHHRRYRAWATKTLEARATELASAINGRRDCAFVSGLKMAPFVAAGILAEDEVIEALRPAWEACRRAPGASRVRPANELDRQVMNGLRRGADSSLPTLS